ncbi:MAG: hypothetical protein E6R03_03485 [Hyphomicrobiaceae bacterium]|nr:MAG: hypothetical protein E6R03_03485 [Hyphomicrobiaceae bacterium]
MFPKRNNFVRLPVCDPNRDTQWNRNYDAVLVFIGGGDVEFQALNGRWHLLSTAQFANQNVMDDALSVFRRYPCRVKAG